MYALRYDCRRFVRRVYCQLLGFFQFGVCYRVGWDSLFFRRFSFCDIAFVVGYSSTVVNGFVIVYNFQIKALFAPLYLADDVLCCYFCKLAVFVQFAETENVALFGFCVRAGSYLRIYR